MAIDGTRSDALTLVSTVSHIIGNRDVSGVKTTGLISMADLATLLIATAPLSTVLADNISPKGATVGFGIVEQEVTLAGAFTDTTIVIPAKSIGLAVTTRVTQLITGATSFSVGISGDTARWASGLGLTLGATNVGVSSPVAYAANTAIRLTAAGSNFSGGKVRVAAIYIGFTAPTS